MTRIPVNMPGFAPNLPVSATKTQTAVKSADFSQILANQKNTDSVEGFVENKGYEESMDTNEEQVHESQKPEDVTEVTTQEVQKESSVKESGETGKDSSSQEDELYSEEQMQLIMPMLQVATTDVKELLAELIGMNQEELDALMENMGIAESDLLDMDVLKSLLLQAGGVDDMAALLTDENLYSGMMNLEEGFAEIMGNVQETLGLTDDEMNALKEQLGKLNASRTPVITVESVTELEGTATKQDMGQENTSGENNPAFAMNGQNPFIVEAPVEQSGIFSTQAGSFVSAETQNIMNQIMDYMNIQLNADTELLEMQLQPESLGTLQIRISAKEGIMTAQFTTASESVKAVLESQMVQLQQQLESQNIKVEAIEVTVQSHAFESALQQGEEKQEASEEKKPRTRAIDLNSIAEMDEISEEDRILAEMMEANGNTVDYLA